MPIRLLIIILVLATMPMASCHADQGLAKYASDGLTFTYPKNWIVKEDLRYPGSQRSVSIETPKTALMTIEMYTKETLTSFPEYQHYDSSLKQFAKRYDGRDITAKLQTKHPVKQDFVHRHGHKGLKETRLFQVGDLVKKTMISEYYRLDSKDEIVFVTVTAPEAEWKTTITGFDTIFKTLKYY